MNNIKLGTNKYGYSLVLRLTDENTPVSVQPYVVVSDYNDQTKTWASGVYHQNLQDALDDFENEDKIAYKRLFNLAQSMIEKSMSEDVQETLDILTEYKVTKDEAEAFGLNTAEIFEDYEYEFD